MPFGTRHCPPLGKPFVWLWRKCLDLPSRVYILRFHAGFLGVLTALLIVAAGLAARLPPEQSVVISILGAFIVERYWQTWCGRVRRNLAEGTSIRVSYEEHGVRQDALWNTATTQEICPRSE